jgi:phage-related protein
MFDIKYNNVRPSAFNAFLATIPVYTPSTKSRTRQTVPKMDGEILVDDVSELDGYWDFTIHAKRDDLTAKERQIRRWLSGTGRLVLSNAEDAYWEVVECNFTTIMKKSEKYGRVAVKMEVYPYEFLNSGQTEITSYSSINNPADICKPLYKITGSGSGRLTVNGKYIDFTVDGTLYIDTRSKHTINGSGQDSDININGEYENLYLMPGSNSISCTAGTLTVTPRWGYKA